MAKWQREKIKIRKDLGPLQREAVGLEIIERIKDRTKKGFDRKGKKFPGYSKNYTESLDFKIAGKSAGKVDLELSSEMMNSIEVLSHKKGEIVIGFDKGNSDLNGKVEGNRLGTYGGKPKRGKKRDFLGIQRKDLVKIQNNYDYNKEERNKIKDRINRIHSILG
jgi:hypothetical protein